MTQTWTDDVFAKGHAYDTDLGNVEINFACLKSIFSGAGAPANPVAGMLWFDTTKKLPKIRDHGNAEWFGIMQGDLSQKIWVYRNSAMDGWVVDSLVTDVVLALKGGTTYTNGADTAGTWIISGITSGNQSASHTHTATTGGASSTNVYNLTPYPGGDTLANAHTHTITTGNQSASHNHTITHDGTSRIAAAVGTLQYLDL
jgi:hypothetical protein